MIKDNIILNILSYAGSKRNGLKLLAKNPLMEADPQSIPFT
jgi:hypothetical protein